MPEYALVPWVDESIAGAAYNAGANDRLAAIHAYGVVLSHADAAEILETLRQFAQWFPAEYPDGAGGPMLDRALTLLRAASEATDV